MKHSIFSTAGLCFDTTLASCSISLLVKTGQQIELMLIISETNFEVLSLQLHTPVINGTHWTIVNGFPIGIWRILSQPFAESVHWHVASPGTASA